MPYIILEPKTNDSSCSCHLKSVRIYNPQEAQACLEEYILWGVVEQPQAAAVEPGLYHKLPRRQSQREPTSPCLNHDRDVYGNGDNDSAHDYDVGQMLW